MLKNWDLLCKRRASTQKSVTSSIKGKLSPARTDREAPGKFGKQKIGKGHRVGELKWRVLMSPLHEKPPAIVPSSKALTPKTAPLKWRSCQQRGSEAVLKPQHCWMETAARAKNERSELQYPEIMWSGISRKMLMTDSYSLTRLVCDVIIPAVDKETRAAGDPTMMSPVWSGFPTKVRFCYSLPVSKVLTSRQL